MLSTRWLSYEELCRLKGIEAMVETYYNSGQFANTLRLLVREFSGPFELYECLAEYYEKKGLIRVNRDSAGRRDYSEDDIEWARFIKRLKDTGMLLRDIRHYSDLRYEGDSTMEERMALLLRHREAVVEQQKKWDGYLKNLDEKIHIYQKRITSPSQTSSSAPQHRPD